jgi:hypothetical protein
MEGMRLFYYIRRFWEIPALEKELFLKGILLSLYYWIIVTFLKLKSYKKILVKKPIFTLEEKDLAIKFSLLKRTLKRIASITPWNCSCLIKSLTFKTLSNSLGVNCSIYFELMKSKNGGLVAHSLVKHDNNIIYLGLNNVKSGELLTI